MPFELFLALRYLRPKRTFVSVMTLISVVGVALGVWALIVVISVMSGFDQELRDKILGFSAHLKVFKTDAALEDYPAVIRAVSSNRNVKAAAPFILGQVMVKTQPQTGKPLVGAPWMRGIDPQLESRVSSLTTNVIIGDFDVEGDGILVGVELAQNLHLNVGDRIAIYSPRNLEEMEKHKGKEDEVVILPDEFVVRGIFDVGYYEYNASVVITSLRSAQSLYQLPGKVHGLLVMLNDPYQAPAVRDELRQSLGPDFKILDWSEENSKILTALAVEKNVMFIVMLIIMVVAAFGITSTLIAFVVHKTREIGVLKALGAARRQVAALFLAQSVFVGLFGIATGFLMARVSLAYRNEFLHAMRQWTGLELFPAAIYSFTELPALILPGDVLLICGSAFVMCLLAGVIPAGLAARLQPVEALRHE
jgi:lipoprotein-releasing system permease protein